MEKICSRITTCFANRRIIDKDEIEIFRYGLNIFFFSVASLSSILIMAGLIGNLRLIVVYYLAFIPLRLFAGGYHAKTHLRCYALSVIAFLLMSVILMIPVSLSGVVVLSGSIFLAIVIIWNLAPVIHKNRQINNKELYYFKRICRIICVMEIVLIGLFILLYGFGHVTVAFSCGFVSEALSVYIAHKNMQVSEKINQ